MAYDIITTFSECDLPGKALRFTGRKMIQIMMVLFAVLCFINHIFPGFKSFQDNSIFIFILNPYKNEETGS